jgi:hypothetical protein
MQHMQRQVNALTYKKSKKGMTKVGVDAKDGVS